MSSVNLNIDILHLIMEGSDQHTVSQLMKTCRFINREGAKYLLAGFSTISTESQASSFLEFALPTRQSADIARRLRWIKSLHILVLDDEEVQVVAQVLKPFFVLVAPHAPNFSLLKIDYAELFFAADPELPAAVASLTTLASLTLDEAGTTAVIVLRALQSSLTKVEVHFDWEFGPFAEEDRDPMSFLHRSEDTLHCISLAHTTSSPTAGCYRNVRMLTLKDVGVPTTRHFVYAFPNLELLRATEWATILEDDADVILQRQRDINVVDQERDGSWKGLTSYKGSLFVLFGLGLRCQVSHIFVHDDDEEGMDPRQILAILRDTSPSHFPIKVQEVEYFLSETDDFLELSEREEFRRLPSFRFHLTLWPRSWNANLEGLIDLICDVVSPSPIASVTVIVDISSATTDPTTKLTPTQNYRPKYGSPRPSPVKLYLDTLDPDTVAERLFTGNPSRCAVKVVFIRATEERPVIAHRGNPELIIDHDFDMYF